VLFSPLGNERKTVLLMWVLWGTKVLRWVVCQCDARCSI